MRSTLGAVSAIGARPHVRDLRFTGQCLALALLLAHVGCERSGPPVGDPPAALRAGGTVTIEIIGDDQRQTFHRTDVLQGTTLEEVMRTIDEVPIVIKGSGTTAFVDQIGQRATGGSEGWTFTIDDEFASTGIGSTRLSPPTKVTWRFGDH